MFPFFSQNEATHRGFLLILPPLTSPSARAWPRSHVKWSVCQDIFTLSAPFDEDRIGTEPNGVVDIGNHLQPMVILYSRAVRSAVQCLTN